MPPKAPQSGTPPKSKKQPEGRRAAAIKQKATEQDVGDTADKITRAPKKKH